jgi:predicted RNase H-like nuclease
VQVVGVDGFKARWVAVVLENGVFTAADVVALEQLSSAFPQAVAIAVDVPIGMPREGFPRAADQLAKAFVGPRRSSVFVTPPRSVLETSEYPEALARSRRVAGVGISSQSFALRAKVLAVYDVARRDPRIPRVPS